MCGCGWVGEGGTGSSPRSGVQQPPPARQFSPCDYIRNRRPPIEPCKVASGTRGRGEGITHVRRNSYRPTAYHGSGKRRIPYDRLEHKSRPGGRDRPRPAGRLTECDSCAGEQEAKRRRPRRRHHPGGGREMSAGRREADCPNRLGAADPVPDTVDRSPDRCSDGYRIRPPRREWNFRKHKHNKPFVVDDTWTQPLHHPRSWSAGRHPTMVKRKRETATRLAVIIDTTDWGAGSGTGESAALGLTAFLDPQRTSSTALSPIADRAFGMPTCPCCP